MASTFPGAIDSFTDPLSGSALNSPSHSAQHADINDAAEKIETYMGLVKVIPTGATNGTVGATGTVTVGTSISTVSVLGCFTSLYDNYKIIWTGGLSVGAEALSLNLLPTSVTGWNTSYYQHIAYNTYGAGVVGLYSNNAAKWTYVGEITSTSKTNINFELFAPNLAQFTGLSNNYVGTGGAGSGAGIHQIASAFTGFTISGASNFTGGTITVYGYRK